MALTLKQRNEIENARNWCEKELESGEESSMLGKREREDDPCERLVKKSVTQTQSQNVSSNCYTDTAIRNTFENMFVDGTQTQNVCSNCYTDTDM